MDGVCNELSVRYVVGGRGAALPEQNSHLFNSAAVPSYLRHTLDIPLSFNEDAE